MLRTLMQVLAWLLVAFLVYSIVVSPDRAADIVEAAWDIVVTGFRSLVDRVESWLP